MTPRKYPIEMVNGVPVVAAPEEIDASNADWLRTVLWEAAARGHGTWVVDMTGTRFCASAGLGVLVRAHHWALADGGELRLVIPGSASVVRVFAITGIDRVISTFPSLYEAVETAPATTPRPPRPRRHPQPGMRTRADGAPPHPGTKTSTA
jgi:anti-anti-sigma factor